MAAAPLKAHQRLVGRLFRVMDAAAEASRAGEVFVGPVDVRFSPHDQVQPDLLFLRQDRSELYQGNTIFGPPDLVAEVLSPSNRAYDETVKAQLYAEAGVPELLLADPIARALRLLVLQGGRYVEVEPDKDGRLPSTVVPGLSFDPVSLFFEIDA